MTKKTNKNVLSFLREAVISVLSILFMIFVILIFSALFIIHLFRPLAEVSETLAASLYFFIGGLISLIVAILLLNPKKIKELFGKDMKQILIDHGNITG